MTETIPIFSTQDLALTEQDYRALGFEIDRDFVEAGYLIVVFEDIELHFTLDRDHDPARSNAACYIRTPKAAELHERWSRSGWNSEGMPRLTRIEAKPWGMTEFALVDSAGALLRVGFETG